MVTDSDLTEAELAELAELLRARRAADVAESERVAESLGAVLAARSDSTADDEHDPEGPTLSYEWTRLQTVRSETTDDIKAVDAALARVENGTLRRVLALRPPDRGGPAARPPDGRAVHRVRPHGGRLTGRRVRARQADRRSRGDQRVAREARYTASVREVAPTFFRMLDTWTLAVFALM